MMGGLGAIFNGLGRRPQLWVYEGQGNYKTMRKTTPKGGSSPSWDFALMQCVHLGLP